MSANLRPVLREITPVKRARQSLAEFTDFLDRYKARLKKVFSTRTTADELNLQRGLPPYVLNHLREEDPLQVYVPREYGGRGLKLNECLAMLEATGYESLPLCLTMGINGGLFLQPLAKYGSEEMKDDVFDHFIRSKRMGGLMITEPDHGSDALSMQTAYMPTGNGTYHIKGTKHWGGLTGWADYWIVTARSRTTDGALKRDIDFFVCNTNAPGQHIEVDEYYRNLGLRMIPYGRNTINIEVPEKARMIPESTGIKMMLDLLNRSRLQFPGMAMGYLRRIMDESFRHTKERFVGGKALFDYDQVKARLARIQASVTTCSAMCLDSSEYAGVDLDLSGQGLKANAIKSVVTDLMHEAAQSLLQLLGAKGYRQDHFGGRALVDSRPFQIFEGSNDILYQQVTEAVLKKMRRMKENNLYQYLKEDNLTARAADYLRDVLSFDVDWSLPQRKLVELGKAIGRIISMEMTIELGERGYHPGLVKNALDEFSAEVRSLLESYKSGGLTAIVDEKSDQNGWLPYVQPHPAN